MLAALLTRKIKAGPELCELRMSCAEAEAAKDALAKAAYERVFDLLVQYVNQSLTHECAAFVPIPRTLTTTNHHQQELNPPSPPTAHNHPHHPHPVRNDCIFNLGHTPLLASWSVTASPHLPASASVQHSASQICLLDIFGMEILAVNGFEQLLSECLRLELSL